MSSRLPPDILDAVGDGEIHAVGGWFTASCPYCRESGFRVLEQGFDCLSCEVTGSHNELRERLGLPPRIFSTLAELLARPELLAPPECVLPRIAYRGRAVLLAAPDKAGKSTLLAHGATAVSCGRSFLGEPVAPGRVVWLGLEEALGDAVRRYSELGADPDRVQLVTMSPPDLRERLDDLLTDWPADLVVIDSLHEYARVTCGETPADGDNSMWGAVVRPLVALARKHEIALVLLHHVRKSDGEGRGPTEIFAAVDATLTMYRPKKDEDSSSRRIEGRGRWAIEPFRVALRETRYELHDGAGISLDARVLIAIEANPGCSVRTVRESVTGSAQKIAMAINELIERGAVVDRGSMDRRAFYAASADPEREVA